MVSTLTRLEQSDNWTMVKVVYKPDVRMGGVVEDRWMVYAKNASPFSSYSLVNHSTTKKEAVKNGKAVAKSYRPALIKIYNKDGSDYRKHEYKKT